MPPSLPGSLDISVHFTIDSNSGIITVMSECNYEDTPAYGDGNVATLAVTVTDSMGLTDSVALTIDVNDVNDAPQLTQVSWLGDMDENAVGTVTMDNVVAAADEDAGDTLTYSFTGMFKLTTSLTIII